MVQEMKCGKSIELYTIDAQDNTQKEKCRIDIVTTKWKEESYN